MKFHHIGIACRNIDEEILNIKTIHNVTHQSPIVFDELQNASLVLLTLHDGTNLELIAGPQVQNLVKKNITYYHICYEVNNLEQEIERLTAQNAKLISPPKPAVLFNNRPVAFLHVSYGLIELLQA